MKKIENNIIDLLDYRVVTIVIFLGIMEFEIFSFGRELIIVAGRDAWLAVLIGSLLVSLATYLLVSLALRFPKENFFDYSKKVWGKPLSYFIAICYFLFWAGTLTILFKNLTEINQIFFLPKTPVIIPAFLLAIGAVWLVSYGFTPVIRFFQITFPFLFFPLFIITLLSLNEIEVNNFLPILEKGILPVIKGAILYAGYLQGLEVILFLIPFLITPRGAIKPALLGITLINLIAFSQIILTIGILGVDNAIELIWPSISILELIEIPGFPAERFGLFLTLPTLIGIFSSLALFLYLLSYGLVEVFNLKNKKAIIYLIAIFTLLSIKLIPNFAFTIQLRNITNSLTLAFIYIIPLLTLGIAVLRKKTGGE